VCTGRIERVAGVAGRAAPPPVTTERGESMANKDRAIDKASLMMLECAETEGLETAWDRHDQQGVRCGFGTTGLCCRHCAMGPCNIDPFGEGPSRGVCGADADTIAARHFGRMIAAGTAAHSDHGRGVAETFMAVAKGEAHGYAIKDEQKLLALAIDLGVAVGDRTIQEIALDVAKKSYEIFGSQEGEIPFIKRAPLKRQAIWREQNVVPRGVDREVVEMMHRTTMGVDQHYENIINHGTRCALADGWGGSMLATDLQDILFGTPTPLLSSVNLGILKEDEVNVIIHGHEPLLSEMIVVASREPEILAYAASKGAKGINLGGICCTANEILMRHGVALAGDFLQQELAVLTGAVEGMVVDVQCVMQGLAPLTKCFHTKLITTNRRAKIEGAEHIEFHEDKALESARKILKASCDAFPFRTKVNIPTGERMDLIAGFSHETINYLLGGTFRASYKPLNDNIINGKIRGIAGVVGCNNCKHTLDEAHVAMVKHLIKNDVIVLQTGCSAIATAKAGLLLPEAAAKYAGAGLAEVCEAVGIPPVLHMGSCVDNSRILMAATAVVKEGGLGDDLSDLPAAGAAPEWMSEKAIAIGQYFVASGVYTVFGVTFPTLGAPRLTKYLFNDIAKTYGGRWDFEVDPIEAANKMIRHIDERRAALGLDKAKERVLYDMAMRRDLDAV
jgi:carbon-monoxide dehydrogenase catalytic subunit